MSNKAFIFDMDGVLANTGNCWDEQKPKIFSEIFGSKISRQLVSMNWRGKHIIEIYKAGVKLGYRQSETFFLHKIDDLAKNIYTVATISPGLKDLLNWLASNKYKIAVVTSSQEGWMNALLARISNVKLIDLKLSLHDDKFLKPKPAPDGYLYAMKKLGTKPADTFVLEDSVAGLESALRSEAKTIWFNAYATDVADLPSDVLHQAKNMSEVQDYLQNLP